MGGNSSPDPRTADDDAPRRTMSAAERQALALQKELQRTREEFKVDEGVPFATRSHAFEQRANALADRLGPAIRSALLASEASPVDAEWAKLTRKRLSDWLNGPEPVSLGLAGRLISAAHRNITTSAYLALMRGSRSALDAEVWDQSIRLAQLLLSNWHGALEHANEEDRPALMSALFSDEGYPLPKTAFECASAFVLPSEVTFEILLKYLRDTEPEGWRLLHPPSGDAP